jgi:hypothetical protein
MYNASINLEKVLVNKKDQYMTKIWFDTEFIDDGETIELLSIGLVREDGAEYYAEIEEADLSAANQWVKDNVIAHFTGPKKPRAQVAQEIVAFCGAAPTFWAWFGSYDWVALSQLYGRMLDVPKGWPNLFNEIVQHAKYAFDGSSVIPNFKKMFPNEKAHNALADARWNHQVWDFCEKVLKAK